MLKKIIVNTIAAAAVTTVVVGAAAVVAILSEENSLDKNRRKRKRLEEGKLIQWLSGGQYMFPKLKKVVRIVDSEEHGTYVFVEGSVSGIPIDQIILQEDL